MSLFPVFLPVEQYLTLLLSGEVFIFFSVGKTPAKKLNTVTVFQTAMEVMQFSKEEVREVLRLLAGVLHLGNIEFITAGGAQVSFKTGKMTPAFLPSSLPWLFPPRELGPEAFTIRPFAERAF